MEILLLASTDLFLVPLGVPPITASQWAAAIRFAACGHGGEGAEDDTVEEVFEVVVVEAIDVEGIRFTLMFVGVGGAVNVLSITDKGQTKRLTIKTNKTTVVFKWKSKIHSVEMTEFFLSLI